MRKLLLLGCLSLVVLSAVSQPNNYRSKATGNWGSASTWENDTAGNGIFANSSTAPTASDGTITIRANDIVTVASSISIDQTVVQLDGILRVAQFVTLTISKTSNPDLDINTGGELNLFDDGDDGAFLVVNGYLKNSGIISYVPALSPINFSSGSTYEHAQDGGTVPTATYASGSLAYITGLVSSPISGLNQNFSNFTWDCPSQAITGSLAMTASKTFSGNVSILNTGSSTRMRFSASNNATITISGNLTVSGVSAFQVTSSSNPVTLNINGNYSNSSSSTTASQLASTGTGIIVLKGNFSQTAGTLQGNATSTFNFSNNNTQTFTSGGTFSTVNFVVKNQSKLNLFGSNAVSGDGNFTVEAGGTVMVGSKAVGGAIQNNATGGNIQVSGSRSYASGSTVIYDGNAVNGNASGQQVIGDGQPSGTGVTTRIDNPSGVALSNDLIIIGTLIQVVGDISVGSSTLTLNGSYTSNGNALNVTTDSNLAIGGTGDFGILNLSGTTTINSLVLTRSSSGKVTLGSDLSIGTNGNFSMDFTELVLNGKTLTIRSDFAQTNGATITVDAAASLVISGAGTLPSSVSISGSTLGSLTNFRSSSTLTLSPNITLTNLNLLSGTIANNSGTIIMTSGGTVLRTLGAFTGVLGAASSYNVTYANSGPINTGPELPTGTTQLNNLSVQGAGAVTLTNAITINGTFTSGGSFAAGSNSINMKGAFVCNVNPTLTSNTTTFSGTTTMSGAANPIFGIMVVTGTLTATIDYQINGTLNTTGGTLSNGSVTTTFAGSPSTITGTPTFNNLTVAAASTLTGPASLTVSGVFRIDGTFNAGSGTVNVGGDWTNNNVFTGGTGTVAFTGTSTIGGGATTNFSHVTINTGATVTPPSVMNVAGNFAINGTFNAGTGRVTFNGTSNQSLDRTSGSGATITLFDIRVDKGSGTFNVNSTVASTVFRVQNEFTIGQNGGSTPDVDFDGSGSGVMVFGSTSTRTAKLTAVPSGAVVAGNLTVERYVENSDAARAYRYFASPVSGATVADWLGEIQITGTFSNPSSGGGIPNPNAPSMFQWIETNGGLSSNRYVAYPDNISNPASSFPLVNGTGYAVYVRATGTPTVDVRGNVVVGDVPITLHRTGSETNAAGYNLVGNPYPAPINWDLVTVPGSVDNGISMLDNVSNAGLGSGQFVYYVKNGPDVGGFTGVIASGQAFWTNTSTDNTVLTFNEANKASDINPIVVRTAQIANLLRINVNGAGRKDETVIYGTEGATDLFDRDYDARKRSNTYINFYSYSGRGDKYAINAVNGIACKRINLGLTQVNAAGDNVQVPVGTYKMNFSDLESFDADYSFTLVDGFVGKRIGIEKGSSYEFQVTTDTLSYGEGRFMIDITRAPVQITEANNTLVSSSAVGNQWYYNTQLIPGATGQTYQPTKSGTYTVEATSSGCTSSAAREFVITGVGEGLPSHIRIFPNPTSGNISIAVDSPNEVSAKVLTIMGVTLQDKMLEGTSVKRGSFNIEEQSEGMYILIVQDGTEVYKTRIIKKR